MNEAASNKTIALRRRLESESEVERFYAETEADERVLRLWMERGIDPAHISEPQSVKELIAKMARGEALCSKI